MENVEEIFDRKCTDEGWKFDNPKARKFIYECMEEARAQALTIHTVISSAEFKEGIKQAIENANKEDWIADEDGEERPVYDLNEDLAAENVIKAIKKHLL